MVIVLVHSGLKSDCNYCLGKGSASGSVAPYRVEVVGSITGSREGWRGGCKFGTRFTLHTKHSKDKSSELSIQHSSAIKQLFYNGKESVSVNRNACFYGSSTTEKSNSTR